MPAPRCRNWRSAKALELAIDIELHSVVFVLAADQAAIVDPERPVVVHVEHQAEAEHQAGAVELVQARTVERTQRQVGVAQGLRTAGLEVVLVFQHELRHEMLTVAPFATVAVRGVGQYTEAAALAVADHNSIAKNIESVMNKHANLRRA